MKIIVPKPTLDAKPGWKVSKKVKVLIALYAEYTKYSENELVEMLLKDVELDSSFQEWLKSRRNKRKIEKYNIESNSQVKNPTDIKNHTINQSISKLTSDADEDLKTDDGDNLPF